MAKEKERKCMEEKIMKKDRKKEKIIGRKK